MQGSLSDQLEDCRIVTFEKCPHALPSDDDLRWLREELPSRLQRKNVSYYPERDRLVGVPAELAGRARAILKVHSATVQAFLKTSLGAFADGWRVGTSSFRPLQERGRPLSAHASNELVHVDAGAYGAMHGDRILRFFTNLNPTADRVWVTKGGFSQLYAKYGQQAGVTGVRLHEGPLDRLRSATLRAVSTVAPGARMLDSSPYDRAMRRFHNFMKDTPAFQADRETERELRFAPYSSWAVLTDAVSHACIEGQFALVDTFVIRLAQCRNRATAPFYVLGGGDRIEQGRSD